MSLSDSNSLDALAQEKWDIIVIGGGISGASVAEVAARARLTCLLLEQRDFAWGASSRSGKWVHGGLRYLKEGQFKVTWHSVREREHLCDTSPGLISLRPMHWLLHKENILAEILIRAGLLAYDCLSGKKRREKLSQKALMALYPELGSRRQASAGLDTSVSLDTKALKGAMRFFEGQTDDARLTLRVIQSAQAAGAVALNYAQVEDLISDDKSGAIKGVKVRHSEDSQCYALYAKQVISATGAWSDKFRAMLRHRNEQALRPLRGSHLIFEHHRLPVSEAIILEHPRDKRPGFIVPFQGRVLVGNTDIDHTQDLHREPHITKHEIAYLLETIQYHFPELNITDKDILSTFSGVRPVVDSGKQDPSKETRDHVIWQENELITIGGGKLTTFQHIAIDALNRAQKKFPNVRFTRNPSIFSSDMNALADVEGLNETQKTRLIGRYGAHAKEMIDASPASERQIIPGTETFWFELVGCAQYEHVRHLDDLLLRRTRIGLLLQNGGEDLLPRIRKLVQVPLAWSDEQWFDEVARYLDIWQQHYSVRPNNAQTDKHPIPLQDTPREVSPRL